VARMNTMREHAANMDMRDFSDGSLSDMAIFG